MADTFDDGEGSDGDGEDGGDDRQRLMRGTATHQSVEEGIAQDGNRPAAIPRRVTELPAFLPPASDTIRRVYGGGSTSVNDGVFANLSAKPEKGEKIEEEKPPVCAERNVCETIRLNHGCRPMSKRQLMQPRHTGKQPFSLPAWYPMKCLSTDSLLGRPSHSSGMA